MNKTGGVLGKQLELINLDCKSDPVTTGNVAVQLIDQGAQAIIAPSDFDFGGPASREAQKAGLVGISPAASSPLYGSDALGDKQFTMSMWNTPWARRPPSMLREQGWQSAYVVTDDFIQYTKDLGEYFTKAWEDGGGEIVYQEKYTQGAADFSAQLARMKALPEQPDFYYISSYMPDLGLIIRTMREAGITTPIVGGDLFDDPGLFGSGSAVRATTSLPLGHRYLGIARHLAADGRVPEGLWKPSFGGRRKPCGLPRAGMWSTSSAGAMDKAGSTDGAAMAKAMEDNNWDLLTGQLDWEPASKGHETHKQAAMVKLVDGKPEFIGWLNPRANLPRRSLSTETTWGSCVGLPARTRSP